MVQVYLRAGAPGMIMGAIWDGQAHVLCIMGTLQVLPHVKRMFFRDNGGMGDVVWVVYGYALTAPHQELVKSREGQGGVNIK